MNCKCFTTKLLQCWATFIVNRKVRYLRNNESYSASTVRVAEVESTAGTRTAVTEPKYPSPKLG